MIKMYCLETGKLLKTFSGHANYIRSAKIGCDGNFLVSGSEDDTIKIWNVKNKK